MKNNKKIKLGKLNFYIVDDNYIEYLSGFDRQQDKTYAYRRLLSEQYKYINLPDNRQKIMDKADKLYTIVTSTSKGKTAKFYKQLSCGFKLLEEQSLKYNT